MPRTASEAPGTNRVEPTTDTEDSLALFRSAIKDVRPLTQAPVPPAPPKPPARARFRRLDEQQVLQESLTLAPGELLVETGDELIFRRAQIDGRTVERLRRGEYTVRDEIDLHGLTEVEARLAVRAFLHSAVAHGLRCVRVIHGKGLGSGPRGPVLKSAVNVWLRNTQSVLAFASARQVDGGTGALYVLLQRSR